MKLLSRVVWAEGMYLAPQHFQAQNRYFEEAVHFATASLWRDSYGLAACQLDADALRNGTGAPCTRAEWFKTACLLTFLSVILARIRATSPNNFCLRPIA